MISTYKFIIKLNETEFSTRFNDAEFVELAKELLPAVAEITDQGGKRTIIIRRYGVSNTTSSPQGVYRDIENTVLAVMKFGSLAFDEQSPFEIVPINQEALRISTAD